jgi:hypothetical protein
LFEGKAFVIVMVEDVAVQVNVASKPEMRVQLEELAEGSGIVTAEGRRMTTLPFFGTAFFVTIVKVYSPNAPVTFELVSMLTETMVDGDACKVMELVLWSIR